MIHYHLSFLEIIFLSTLKLNDFPEFTGVIEISDEVQNALHHGKPVVALESTIVTHGMPHPNNLE